MEGARAIHRLRHRGGLSEATLADAEREINQFWLRCEFWEITRAICETARNVAPASPLRSLDAIHLATFVTARERIEDLELLTVDDRLRAAAEGV